MIFGSYPEIVTAENRRQKIDLLHDLAGSYLFKDLLALDRIKSSRVLLDLVKLLAFQVCQEVSLNELATQLNVDVKTIGRYLDPPRENFCDYPGRWIQPEFTERNNPQTKNTISWITAFAMR